MSLLAELKRRNVFRVAITYGVVAWLLIQVIVAVLPQFDAPRWIVQTLIFLLVLGFPVALILAWAYQITPEGIRLDVQARSTEMEVPVPAARLSPVLNAAILALVVLAVGFLLIDRYRAEVPEAATVVAPVLPAPQGATQRLSLVLPAEAPIRFGCSPCSSLALSPDGSTVAYVAHDPDAEGYPTLLVVRRLESLTYRALEGTEGAVQPFFSPDGQWLGFFTDKGELKKLALGGGGAVTLAKDLNGALWGAATWLEDQTIVFRAAGKGLFRVPAAGGAVEELTRMDSTAGEIYHLYPSLIPGTSAVLFTAIMQRENQLIPALKVIDTVTGEVRTLLEEAGGGIVVDKGYLLFSKSRVLMVAPFDASRLAFTGLAVPLPEAIRFDGATGEGDRRQMAVSRNGSLAYVPPTATERRLYLVSRDGSSEALPLRTDSYYEVSVAPDGRQAALVAGSGQNYAISLYDFERGTSTQLSRAETEFSPVWHPGSRQLITTVRDQGKLGLWQKGLNGNERLLLSIALGEFTLRNGSLHPDGQVLAITRQDGDRHDIVLVTLGDEVTVEPWLATAAQEHSPRFSPDGNWLAYVSDKSGSRQVYLRGFPDGEELRVSTGTLGLEPHWSHDGSELYFMQGSDNALNLSAVQVESAEGTAVVSQPQLLFPLAQRNAAGTRESFGVGYNWGSLYGVMPDGRFLMTRGLDGSQQQEIVLVQNWLTELRRMAPADGVR
jgi:eukaryotic-like serine/threonine-protein kinase